MKSTIITKLGAMLTVVFGVGMLVSSCADNPIDVIRPNDSDNAMVSFALKLPHNATPKTRALDAAAEDKVSSIEIIAFKNGLYSYITYPVTAISGNKFTVKLVKGEFDILVLSNSRSATDALPSLTGKTKQQVVDLLTDRITAADKKWSADVNSGTYRNIPMSSEIFTKEIKDGTDFSAGKDGEIKLHRMLAKVDVKVTGEAAANFKLLELDVFNYNLLGNIVPKFVAATPAVNVPLQSRDGVNSYLQYTLGSAALAYEGEIYLMEAESLAADGITPLVQNERTCLVVKGEYEGGEYYYRMDFSNNTTFMNILRNHQYIFNITKVSNIGFVTPEEAFLAGPVNMTVEVAAWNNGNMSNIQTNGLNNMGVSQSVFELTKEAQAGNKLFVFTDYHGSDLSVSYSSSATDATQTIAWITNQTKTDDGATSGLKTYTLGFDTELNSGAPRTGYIHLRAGSLYMVVKVNQTDVLPMSLQILRKNSEGKFDQVDMIRFVQDDAATAPKEETYMIRWSPKSAKVAVNISGLGADYALIEWDGVGPGDDAIIENELGEEIFIVKPKPFTTYVDNSFAEHQSLMTARMAVSGETILTTVVFQQVVKDMHVIYDAAYVMDGIEKKHFMTVKSNVDWDLEVTKNLSSGMGTPNVPVVEGLSIGQKLVADGSYNLPQGNKVFFTPVEDLVAPVIYSGTLGLDLVDKTSILTTISSELLCASGIPQDGKEANSYILDPTKGAGILIPVRNANGVITTRGGTARMQPDWSTDLGTQITDVGVNSRYGARLLWTDTPGTDSKGLANDAALSMVIHAGEGPNGYLLVMPGRSATPKTGNAVVAITRNQGVENGGGTGDILWSFHIWVTDYVPEVSTNWMDRNMGAVNVDPMDVGSRGNYYQWGRKDPFPGAKAVTQNSGAGRDIYNANGVITLPLWSTVGNVFYSTRNPMNPATNWTGSNDTNKTLSWNTYDGANGQKTAYDPCPDGWRTPIRNLIFTWDNSTNIKYWGREDSNVIAISWSAAELGVNWPQSPVYKGGYYPGAGYFGNNVINSAGSTGSYWSASAAAGSNAYGLGIGSDVIPSRAAIRQDGASVRCVTE